MTNKTIEDAIGKHTQLANPFIFVSHWRSLPAYELVSYVLMFASAPMFAYGINQYDSSVVIQILFSVVALYAGFFAALIWNDISDADIDSIAHPDRPIPSGKISIKKIFTIALFFSALTFIFSYLVNFWCLILVGGTALFVTFHNKYLKRLVPLPAYSEIFTPIQWIIIPVFGFIAVNGSNIFNMVLLMVFIYFADNAHDVSEGIHDLEGDQKHTVRTYANSFGIKTASYVSFSMFFISGIIGFFFVYRGVLTVLFLIPFSIMWLYTLYNSFKLIKSSPNDIQEYSEQMGRKGFNYFLFAFDMIFVDIFIHLLIIHNYI